MTPGEATYADAASALGVAAWQRFEHTGDLSDIRRAVEAWQLAVEHTPASSPTLAERLSLLGVALLGRFERTGHLPDLDRAVSTAELLVGHPDVHGRRPGAAPGLP